MAAKLIVLASAVAAINAALLPAYPTRSHFVISTVPQAAAPIAIPAYSVIPAQSSSASAAAQNGLAQAAAAQIGYPGQYQSAISQAQNAPGYESAISSANSLGYGSSLSAAQNAPGYQSAYSSALGNGALGNYGSSIAAAQNIGAYKSSVAQSVQQYGNKIQNSGASSYSAPGLQLAQSQATNTGTPSLLIY